MFFQHVAKENPDPVFGLVEMFKADPRPNKVNLIAGIYKDEHLEAHLMGSAKKALEKTTAQNFTADYLPIDGLSEFCSLLAELSFGSALWKENQERIYGAQSLGGTGALQLAGQFLAHNISPKIALSNPTWANHHGIFKRAGCQISTYPYYDEKNRRFDADAFCAHLHKMEEKTAVLLHTVCHNPTGCDPSEEEWQKISQTILKKKLIAVFDFAYQGFGESIEKDRLALEIFLKNGHEMLVAYSCSKNFSLCRQRVGALFVVSENKETKIKIASQIKSIIRALYSNPPGYGATIAVEILKTASLKKEWEHELEAMRYRLASAREVLVARLSLETSDFDFLSKQRGMFSYTGLKKEVAETLRSEFGVYILDTGRISLSGINAANIDYVANTILSVYNRLS